MPFILDIHIFDSLNQVCPVAQDSSFFFLFFLQVMERTFRTMGLHPTYLEAFKATHEQILTGDGPISLVDRHHLALMVKANLIYYLHCPSSPVWFYKESIFLYGSAPPCSYGKNKSHIFHPMSLWLIRNSFHFPLFTIMERFTPAENFTI